MRFLKGFNRFVHYKKNMNRQLVFVYGTLKQGEPNHYWLESKDNGHAKFVSEGMTVKKYPLVIASKYNIPFLLHSPGRGENVKGELYEVDDNMLSNLDVLEDHPSFYIREIDQVQITSQTGGKESNDSEKLVDCWIYFLKKFKPELLENDYLVEYHSEGDHAKPYTPRQKRIPGYHAKSLGYSHIRHIGSEYFHHLYFYFYVGGLRISGQSTLFTSDNEKFEPLIIPKCERNRIKTHKLLFEKNYIL